MDNDEDDGFVVDGLSLFRLFLVGSTETTRQPALTFFTLHDLLHHDGDLIARISEFLRFRRTRFFAMVCDDEARSSRMITRLMYGSRWCDRNEKMLCLVLHFFSFTFWSFFREGQVFAWEVPWTTRTERTNGNNHRWSTIQQQSRENIVTIQLVSIRS
jgi:hypothetical protein